MHVGDELSVDGLTIRGVGGRHAVIHPEIPVIDNISYLVGDADHPARLMHPGDALFVPGEPVEVLATPAAAPWMKISEAVDYLRAVAPDACGADPSGRRRPGGPRHLLRSTHRDDRHRLPGAARRELGAILMSAADLNNLFGLSGKTALVTGGTRGIGMMMARGLLQAGARVIVSSRKADACEQAVEQLSAFGEVRGIAADLSRQEECKRLAAEVLADTDELHILVNNAGATWGEPLENFPASAWDKVLDLNVKSPFWMVQELVPALRKAGTHDDPARVINIGSIDAIHVSVMPTYSYSASKAALHQMTRVLAKELGPQHITVNAVAPGPFPSKMMAATLDAFGEAIAASAPLRRIGRDDDMAGIAIFLASRAGSYVNGAIIPVDGGIATTASGSGR